VRRRILPGTVELATQSVNTRHPHHIPNECNSVRRRSLHQMERPGALEQKLLLGFDAEVAEAVFYLSSEFAVDLTSGWYWVRDGMGNPEGPYFSRAQAENAAPHGQLNERAFAKEVTRP
jgi:hypothetical protein